MDAAIAAIPEAEVIERILSRRHHRRERACTHEVA
jgi:hypothetical protein